MGEWFASVAESFSKAFLVSGRYVAYLNGFKTTLILSFFAVIVGVMLGFQFPAGRYVDELASKSEKKYKINLKLNNGNCNLSGVENKCKEMFRNGEKKEDICRYCIDYIMTALEKMMLYALAEYGDMPVVFSGGVMSNSIIKKYFTEKYGAYFAEPEFSSDNAAGIAILASMRK